MTPPETAASYDRIAEHWNSDTFDRENGIRQHRRALQFAPGSGSAIDIGCGASGRIIDLLLPEGFSVEGLDISAEMLRLARLGIRAFSSTTRISASGTFPTVTTSSPRGTASGMFP